MQYAAQPAGTPPAQALINRGADPELLAPNAYAFFKSCRLMLHPQPRAGNTLAVLQSSVVSLIGKYFLVIDPDECIDCALCEPECPVDAIFSEDELPEEQAVFLELNAELAEVWPCITEMKPALPDAEEWAGKPDKLALLER